MLCLMVKRKKTSFLRQGEHFYNQHRPLVRGGCVLCRHILKILRAGAFLSDYNCACHLEQGCVYAFLFSLMLLLHIASNNIYFNTAKLFKF